MKSILRRLRILMGSRREAQLAEELAFHLEEEFAERQAKGLSSEDARYAARRSLGNVGRVQEETRAAWGFGFIETTLQDLRFAARSLRKSPGFSLLAVLILGLGIGASTAVFSVVNAVILKPLAYRDADRIVALNTLWKKTGLDGNVSLPDFEDWRTQSASFDSMAQYDDGERAIVLESGGQFANVARVSTEFFRVFGVEPFAGRVFDSPETAAGSGGAAVVSYAFSKSRFGDAHAARGKTLRLAGHALPIVGILPPGFSFPEKTEIWIPADTIFRITPANRGGHNFQAVGRLKPGVSPERAQAEMTVIGNRLEQQYAGTNGGKNAGVLPLRDELVRGLTTMLYLLLGAVLLVLLIACGNVANLLLAKAATRTRELGVRAALGAARGRLIRQLTTENLVLAVAAGIVGVVIARFGAQALVSLAPGDVPRLGETGIDTAVLAFAAGLCSLACLLFGLAPVLRATRVDLNSALKQAGARGAIGGSGLRSALVVAEIALSVVLLTGAGLLIRSFAGLTNVALGFETRQIVVMGTNTPSSNLEEAIRAVRTYKTFLEESRSIPGIAALGATRIPPGRVGSQGSYEVDGAASLANLSVNSPHAVYSIVSPGAFAALGIPVRLGRDFSDADGPDAPLTAIVNETLARRTFPGQNPIGHSIFTGMDVLKPMTIIGVVGDIHQLGPAEEGQAEVYMPYEQHPLPSTALRILVRTSGPSASVIEALRQKAKQIMPETPVRFTTMEERMSENVATPRFRTLLLGIFAAIAVVLAMAGVYGVVSFLVNQRTQEIGLRMALGATTGQVMKMVLSQGVRMAVLGLAVGVAGAIAATRLLTSMLFEVKPFDPLTYAAVALVVAFVTLAACFLPARRAARVDPMLALRQE